MFGAGMELGRPTQQSRSPVARQFPLGGLITITLSVAGRVGSAFNGNGSEATILIGATNYGTFTLPRQSDAFLTFSAFNYGHDEFGLGTFDNLSVSLVPEPGTVPLGGLGALALLRRRRPHQNRRWC